MSTSQVHDYIICGSGPIETLIYGFLAENQKKVILIESNSTFGGFYQTKSIINFIDDMNDNGSIICNNIKQYLKCEITHRLFSIDMMPLVMFANDDINWIIKNSDSCQNACCINTTNIFTYYDHQFSVLPITKSKIFRDKRMNNMDRRHLQRFVSSMTTNRQFGHSEFEILPKLNDTQLTISQYMRQCKIPSFLTPEFLHTVCQSHEKAIEAIPFIHHFMNCMTLGQSTPFSTLQYGSSNLCLSLINFGYMNGGHHCLGRQIEMLSSDSVNLYDQSKIHGKTILSSPLFFASSKNKKLYAHRRVMIISKPLTGQQKSFTVILPGEINNQYPIYLLQLDRSNCVCVENTYILHFWSLSELTDLQDIVPKDIIIFDAQFDLMVPNCIYPKGVIPIEYPSLIECPFGTDPIISKAKEIAEKLIPGAEFYPSPQYIEMDVPVQDSQPKPIQISDEETSYDSSDIEAKILELGD